MLCKIAAEPFPALTGNMINHAFANKNKIVHVTNGPKDNMSEYYTVVGESLGTHAPMEEDTEGNKTGIIYTNIKYPSDTPSQSYSHSNTRQPFHTDGSYESNAPQVSYFFCKTQAQYGGATIFIENQVLIETLHSVDLNLLEDLLNTEILFRKGSDSKSKPVIDEKRKLTWNWHRCDQHLPLAQKFHEFLEKKIFDGGLYESIILKEGEALFFMDEEVLHGRHSFIGSRWLVKGGIYYERPNNS
jgi:alpha-ketoglutarate-dependent taurine dioxygenase